MVLITTQPPRSAYSTASNLTTGVPSRPSAPIVTHLTKANADPRPLESKFGFSWIAVGVDKANGRVLVLRETKYDNGCKAQGGKEASQWMLPFGTAAWDNKARAFTKTMNPVFQMLFQDAGEWNATCILPYQGKLTTVYRVDISPALVAQLDHTATFDDGRSSIFFNKVNYAPAIQAPLTAMQNLLQAVEHTAREQLANAVAECVWREGPSRQLGLKLLKLQSSISAGKGKGIATPPICPPEVCPPRKATPPEMSVDWRTVLDNRTKLAKWKAMEAKMNAENEAILAKQRREARDEAGLASGAEEWKVVKDPKENCFLWNPIQPMEIDFDDDELPPATQQLCEDVLRKLTERPKVVEEWKVCRDPRENDYPFKPMEQLLLEENIQDRVLCVRARYMSVKTC